MKPELPRIIREPSTRAHLVERPPDIVWVPPPPAQVDEDGRIWRLVLGCHEVLQEHRPGLGKQRNRCGLGVTVPARPLRRADATALPVLLPDRDRVLLKVNIAPRETAKFALPRRRVIGDEKDREEPREPLAAGRKKRLELAVPENPRRV
jgi:hypothetical protein